MLDNLLMRSKVLMDMKTPCKFHSLKVLQKDNHRVRRRLLSGSPIFVPQVLFPSYSITKLND